MGATATVDHILALARDSGGPHVSLFLPVDSDDPERLAGLVRRARAQLSEFGWPSDFLRDPPEDGLTHQRGTSAALFAAPGWQSWFPIPHPVRELAVVGESFHIKPALPILGEHGRFHVLALSASGVRLYTGNRTRLTEVHAEVLEATPQQVLAYDRLQKQREFHIAGHAGSHGRVIAHGQGIGGEVRKEHLHQYLVHVARALPAVIPPGEPVVLAGVTYLQSMFRQSWPKAIPESVVGNVEHLAIEALHARSLACVERDDERRRHAATEGFFALRGTDLAVTRTGAVLTAAQQGRVDTLWVSLDEDCWGTPADPNTCEPQQRPGTEDLLNLAATRTLQTGGKVYAVAGDEVPEGGPIAAVLRY